MFSTVCVSFFLSSCWFMFINLFFCFFFVFVWKELTINEFKDFLHFYVFWCNLFQYPIIINFYFIINCCIVVITHIDQILFVMRIIANIIVIIIIIINFNIVSFFYNIFFVYLNFGGIFLFCFICCIRRIIIHTEHIEKTYIVFF